EAPEEDAGDHGLPPGTSSGIVERLVDEYTGQGPRPASQNLIVSPRPVGRMESRGRPCRGAIRVRPESSYSSNPRTSTFTPNDTPSFSGISTLESSDVTEIS